MPSPRRSVTAVALAAAVLGSSAATAAAASPAMTHTSADKGRSADAIARFWTPQRMRHARPLRLPSTKGRPPSATRRRAPGGPGRWVKGSRRQIGARGTIGHTRRPGGAAPAHLSYFGLPELPWINANYGVTSPRNPVGRLYFQAWDNTVGWYSSYCTGTLVAANVVLTAAHCIRGGSPTGTENQMFTFAPAVNATSRPFGTFSSSPGKQTYWTSWYSAPYNTSAGTGSGGFWGTDYAFVKLNRDASGRNAGDLAGWYGIYSNAPKTDIWHLGYPAEGGWNGCAANNCRPWQCASPIQKYDAYAYLGKWDLGFSCFTTGGASGGPIMQYIAGSWYVTSVLSHMGVVHHCSDQPGICPAAAGTARYGLSFYGARLDADTLSLYNYARAL